VPTQARRQIALQTSDSKRRLQLASRPRADRDHRGAAGVDGFDDFGVVVALQVDRCDPEVAVPELALDDDQWDAFAGQGMQRSTKT
jgi:hypothetical protein